MRPRGITRGNDTRVRQTERAARAASMRPRGITRGNATNGDLGHAQPAGFNEAAGYYPRKQDYPYDPQYPPFFASMRPRGITRGN